MILHLIYHIFFILIGLVGILIFPIWYAQLVCGFFSFIEFGRLLEDLIKNKLNKLEKKLLE